MFQRVLISDADGTAMVNFVAGLTNEPFAPVIHLFGHPFFMRELHAERFKDADERPQLAHRAQHCVIMLF